MILPETPKLQVNKNYEYSPNKIDNFYITEILLKVVFKIKHLNPTVCDILITDTEQRRS
jgi:hypothetical protein